MANVSHRTSGLYLPPTDRAIDLINDLDERLTIAEEDILELQASGGGGGGGTNDPNVLYVESFGAVGDGVTSDTAAFQATIAAAIALGRHEIQLMAKTYLLTRQTVSSILCGVSLNGVTKLTIRGAGRYATVIKMEPVFATGCRGLLRLTSCSDIRLCDFTLDGSWNGEAGDEQIHLLELNSVGGKLGVLATDPDGVSTSITLVTPINANQFTVGLSYDFWAANLAQPIGEPIAGGPYQCASRNTTTGVVTFTTPISAAVGVGYIPCLAGGDVKRVWIDNISFRNARGDGIRLQGESANKVRHVWAENLDFINCKRAAMTMQRNTTDVTVDGIYAESGTDAIIDLEPSPSGNALAPKRLKFSNCYFQRVGPNPTNRVVSIVGFSVDPVQDVDFDNVIIMDGTMQIFRAEDFRLRGLNITGRNTVDSYDLQPLEIRDAENGYVGFSSLTRPAGAASGSVVGVLLDDVNICKNVVFESVFVHQFISDTPAVQVHSSAGITFRDCHFFHETSSVSAAIGLQVRANSSTIPVDDFALLDCTFHGAEAGGTYGNAIQFAGNPSTIGRTRVEGCRGDGIVIGAQYQGTTGYTAQPRHMNNDWTCSSGSYFLTVASPGLKAIIVDGNTGTRIEYQGLGTPEGALTGKVGDIYYRTDGAAGTLVYQKDTGTGNTGWIAKS